MKKTKFCPYCKQDKPMTSEYFYRDKSRQDGFNGYCKECRKLTINPLWVKIFKDKYPNYFSEYCKKWRIEHPDAFKKWITKKFGSYQQFRKHYG